MSSIYHGEDRVPRSSRRCPTIHRPSVSLLHRGLRLLFTNGRWQRRRSAAPPARNAL